MSRHGGKAGTEGGHGERQNTEKLAKKGGGLAAPERSSKMYSVLFMFQLTVDIGKGSGSSFSSVKATSDPGIS